MNRKHIHIPAGRKVLHTAFVAAMLLTSTMAMAQGGTPTGVKIHGNVYGGGNLGDVGTHTDKSPASVGNYDWKDKDGTIITANTAADKMTGVSTVNITSDKAEVQGNVYGGGKGEATSFECEKGMVYQTKVDISKGTVKRSVYGGGEVSRVEENTVVTIGASGTEPKIEGSVFGAGAGVETHGYSALVRGTSTVTVQGSAQVWHNVYGGGEKASVGRYKVKTPANETQGDVPATLPYGMPASLISGGTSTVNILGSAIIGKDDIENSGYVYGAGKGLEPNMDYDYVIAENYTGEGEYKEDEHKPKRMVSGNTWEYFANKAAYLQFVETLAISAETDVTITGEATIKGSVFGGSESGFVYKNTLVKIQGGTVHGNAFGGGRGLESFAEAGRVRWNTNITISSGIVQGNVYGGGNLGDVGTIVKPADYNYTWKNSNANGNINDTGNDNVANHNTNATATNTGICTVTISGGTIGTGAAMQADGTYPNGNVFGAGKGSESTWWCEKAMAFATNVTITGGTVNGTVYGGGEVGRVGDDTKVVIGESGATGEEAAPTITGNVYGAGAGKETHGYSALARGNALVTVQGKAQVGGSVYGGGEIASVGKFTVVKGLPTKPETGGDCIVNIKDNAKIGTSGTTHHVFGACKGVTPHYNSASYKDVYSMQTYENRPDPKETPGDTWDYWVTYDQSYTGQKFIKRYYKTKDDYLAFLNTLALTSNPHVTIGGTWTANETTGTVTPSSGTPSVYGSVYGGGQRGVTLGAVDVNIVGGDIHQDVYGGGALADTNLGNWDVNGYVEATGLTVGTSSVTGLYTRTGTEGNYTYTKITDEGATAANGTTYYRQEATWAHAEKSAYYKTTVDLTGGYIHGDAYGGGLGQKTGFNSATENIEATVWGDIDVTLDGTKFDITYENTTDQKMDDDGNPVTQGGNPVYVQVVKSGRVFGCNNLLGSPQGYVTVTVNRTVEGNTGRTPVADKNKEEDRYHSYELAAVYGGGNLAPYTAEGKKAHVIINGCDLTSILTVYGGGNAAPVPETDVDVFSAYEIGALFGGGNGKDKYTTDGGTTWVVNPGANINGNANTLIYGGTVHEAYGGSNEKGTITGSVTIDIADSGLESTDPGYCALDVAKLVGAGKNADVNGDLKIIMGCKPNETIPLVFGGADNANVNGNVELTITSGNFGEVYGGNNKGGAIKGYIKLNIEETTCIPINIEHLYLCGNNAAYSQYGYYVRTTQTDAGTGTGAAGEQAILTEADKKIQLVPRDSVNDRHLPVDTYSYSTNDNGDVVASWTTLPRTGNNPFEGYAAPVLNIISCTSIGEVFGGGFGADAIVYGNPTVNINMIPGAHADQIDRDGVSGADGNTDALGEIGDVYGGGDAAAVYGNTTVNIGTATSVPVYVFDNDNTSGEYVLQYDGETPRTITETVTGAYITGNVYGGGKLADVGKYHEVPDPDWSGSTMTVIDAAGNTNVNICAKYNETSGKWESVAEGSSKVIIGGNVYGGGKGANTTDATKIDFYCRDAMVLGNKGDLKDGGTNVRIGNGTVVGNVYGGGEISRVDQNTVVEIGFGTGVATGTPTSAPDIKGTVFGAGAGLRTHGYSALVRGHSSVTIEGNAKIGQSVYGGGELATVGRYYVVGGVAKDHISGGACTVEIGGYAEIGPDDMVMNNTTTGKPDDYGHVFGAGKGTQPYEGFDDSVQPWSMTPGGQTPYTKFDDLGSNDKLPTNYVTYIRTLALATETEVTIKDHAFVKGCVFGGSENGFVQQDTHVTIQDDCQIGSGYVQMTDDGIYLDKLSTPLTPLAVNRRYTDDEWTAGHLIMGTDDSQALKDLVSPNNTPTYYTTSLPECASWPYGQAAVDANKYAPYDPCANTTGDLGKYANGNSTEGGRAIGDDGHTFYGSVFGGGSGYYPYKPGRWFVDAGAVYGNARVDITGGHILTNVYGGNELTDVGKYELDNQGKPKTKITSGGKCTITMSGGTIGVPRTLKQIAAHPVTCYLFGAGKGDPRILFNKSTNVGDVEVNITGGTIYGSVFGGGEDGHVMRDVKMTIGEVTTTGEGDQAVTTRTGPTIGTWGTSYVDGNVFGGGRGFTGEAYTAGNVAGSIELDIKGGTMLGSIYGGGRLGSVGYGLFESTNTTNYGVMQDDNKDDEGNTTDYYTKGAVKLGRGHIDITISGGTIGNTLEYIIPNATNMAAAGIPEADRDISKWNDTNKYWDKWKTYHNIPKTEFDTTTGRVSHTKGGNVFAGGMGNFYKQDGRTYISDVDWWKMGCAKSTKVTISGGAKIRSCVYGGGELGMVQGGNHTSADSKTVSTEIIINGGIIGTEVTEKVNNVDVPQYTFGSVFGGGYGSLIERLDHTGSTNPTYSTYKYTYPKYIAGRVKGSTEVTMTDGTVLASVYGGGEMAAVGESKVLSTSTDPVVLGETLTGNNGAPIVANTYVTISGGTIGKEKVGTIYFGGSKMGNVYGGGSGDDTTVRSGHVYGNTNVNVSNGTIYHNVYGGGAYGSVGDFDYDTKDEEVTVNNQTVTVKKVSGVKELKTSGTGTATVSISGGTIGYDGMNNGMIFGSSRGDINEPGQRDDHTAWVYDTHVTIGTAGTPASETQAAVPATGPYIKGSVYGSGENGHVFNNTVVTVNGGKIGIDDSEDPGYTVTSGGKTYHGAEYGSRGNVYGAGCGTDKYYSDHAQENHDGDGQLFNPLAGIVYGNTTVNINDGTVVRNVYGAGSMGSVGRTVTQGESPTTTYTYSGGLTTVNVSGGTIGTSGTVGDGNVFGAARGDLSAIDAVPAHADLSRVFNTNVSVSGGTVKGNVYGGGELGDVGILDKSDQTDYNYVWIGMNSSANTSGTNNNTGICTVIVSGGEIGTGVAANADGIFSNGNVYGAGKGSSTTWWCEKAIAYATDVTVSAGIVRGTIYGGGEVGRVEDDAKVTIGVANATGNTPSPTITGNVFGAGAGIKTHGYSALVRGNSDVTVQGTAQVGGSVYGGGEIASVGKFTVPGGLPKDPLNGGTCTVKVKGNAKIGASGTTHNVYGACKGVTPAYSNDPDDPNRSKSMQLRKNAPGDASLWSSYNNDDSSLFIWRYYATEADYLVFLRTLGLTSNTHVTIDGNSEVHGSVYGGGERGITLGGADVNMAGGTVYQDVYGGGSLADSNTSMWDATQNKLVDFVALSSLIPGTSATGYYSSQSADALIRATDATVQSGTTYYAKYKTNVNLTGGTVENNVYGGGLGQLAKGAEAAVLYTAADEEVINGTKEVGDVKTPAVAAVPAIAAKVYGDVAVALNKPTDSNDDTTYGDCEVKGTIFGCNNLNGSPQAGVDVHVYKTVKKTSGAVTAKPAKDTDTYEVTAVYGGGNMAAYYPDDVTYRATAKTNVTIDGCELTSIGSVYGGGNAASVPETNVIVNGTYEIGKVFGGGNGAGKYQLDGKWYQNPGANVGYLNYTHSGSGAGTEADPILAENNTDPDASTLENRIANYSDSEGYGQGKAHATILGGIVHKVYGGSDTRGNVRVEARATLNDGGTCEPYTVGEAYGGGNNAMMDGNAVLEIGCISGLGIAFGGASNADVNGDVVLNITNGTYGQVFGGNDLGGLIRGSIKVNIEETGCRPIIIGELYGGGNRARYSVYGYDASGNVLRSGDKVADPQVNVYSFTSIGNIFGGGYGEEATMVGDPQVNIDVYEGKYADTYSGNPNVVVDNYTVFGYPVPTHASGAIGAINNVYGGGNAAEVIGTPTVNIGTHTGDEVYEEMAVTVGTTSVTGKYIVAEATSTAVANTTYYQKNGDVYVPVSIATGESVVGYYTVAQAADGTAVSNTTYCEKKTIQGVDIRGNVYGGGNNAAVTGNTNVVIGKRQE